MESIVLAELELKGQLVKEWEFFKKHYSLQLILTEFGCYTKSKPTIPQILCICIMYTHIYNFFSLS